MIRVVAKTTLVYLYGPPAVGKLTVARELHRQTGFKLFHNHLTVDAVRPVFDFASPPFMEVIHRLRLDVFETAANHRVSLIFTNNSVWGIPNGRSLFAAFAEEAKERVERAGGTVLFVQLTAATDALVERVGSASRRDLGKLVKPERLLQLLAQLDSSPLHPDDLVIDTGRLQPPESAAQVMAQLRSADGWQEQGTPEDS